jgi:hypothetical protein
LSLKSIKIIIYSISEMLDKHEDISPHIDLLYSLAERNLSYINDYIEINLYSNLFVNAYKGNEDKIKRLLAQLNQSNIDVKEISEEEFNRLKVITEKLKSSKV